MVICVIDVFLLIKNDIIVRYNKFPNLGVNQAIFPNLKGLDPLPKIAQKIPAI